ncbi:hypothetical protein AOLI_G00089810 [Acnodon oligacanthus]
MGPRVMRLTVLLLSDGPDEVHQKSVKGHRSGSEDAERGMEMKALGSDDLQCNSPHWLHCNEMVPENCALATSTFRLPSSNLVSTSGGFLLSSVSCDLINLIGN